MADRSGLVEGHADQAAEFEGAHLLMTAPASAYPHSVDDLMPDARALAARLDDVPSRNRIMQDLRVGAPKAQAIRTRLIEERARAIVLQNLPRTPESAPSARVTEVDQTPESEAVPTPDAGPARPVGSPKASPQVAVDGHPGTKINKAVSAPELTPAPSIAAEPYGPEPTRVLGRPRGLFRRRKAAPKPSPRPNPEPDTKAAQTSTQTSRRDPQTLAQLLRIRWGVRLVLALGVAASIAGNVLHARDELISQIISAWSPLALLLTIELISRVPVHRRHLAVARWAATALIAGIAAWVSYWHMAAVASRYGETNGAQYLLPLSVDGLVVVASICLVELGGRIRSGFKSPVS